MFGAASLLGAVVVGSRLFVCVFGVYNRLSHIWYFVCGGHGVCRSILSSLYFVLCDRVKLASVEDLVHSPLTWEVQLVREWSHDLIDVEGSISKGF